MSDSGQYRVTVVNNEGETTYDKTHATKDRADAAIEKMILTQTDRIVCYYGSDGGPDTEATEAANNPHLNGGV